MNAHQETRPNFLQDPARDSPKDRPELVRKRSFFSKPQIFQKAKTGLKKSHHHGDAHTKKPALTTKTVTKTKTEIVDGQKIVETTVTTVTEPTVPRGLKGKIMKTLKPTTKTTQHVVTRQSVPIEAPLYMHGTTDESGPKNPKTKELATTERSVMSNPPTKIPATPPLLTTVQVPNIGPQYSLHPRSEVETPKIVLETEQNQISSSPEPVPQMIASIDTATNAARVKKVATPPPPLGSTQKQSFLTNAPIAKPTKEEPIIPLDETPETIANKNEHASTDQLKEKQAKKENHSAPPVKRQVGRKTTPSVSAPAGVPTMFAHAFPTTKKRTNARKQRSAPKGPGLPVQSGSHSRAPLKPLAPVQEGVSGPAVEENSPATVPSPPEAGAITETKDDVISSSNHTVVDQFDEESEYEEFTIYDDQIYEITYFEEETVYSQESQQHKVASKSPKPLTGPGAKVEGMELVLINIRLKVPTVN